MKDPNVLNSTGKQKVRDYLASLIQENDKCFTLPSADAVFEKQVIKDFAGACVPAKNFPKFLGLENNSQVWKRMLPPSWEEFDDGGKIGDSSTNEMTVWKGDAYEFLDSEMINYQDFIWLDLCSYFSKKSFLDSLYLFGKAENPRIFAITFYLQRTKDMDFFQTLGASDTKSIIPIFSDYVEYLSKYTLKEEIRYSTFTGFGRGRDGHSPMCTLVFERKNKKMSTKNIHQTVCNLAAAGYTNAQIAKEVGCKTSQVPAYKAWVTMNNLKPTRARVRMTTWETPVGTLKLPSSCKVAMPKGKVIITY